MGLLNYCTFRLEEFNDAQNVSVDTARGKDNDQQNLLNGNAIVRYITRSLQMSADIIILFISS